MKLLTIILIISLLVLTGCNNWQEVQLSPNAKAQQSAEQQTQNLEKSNAKAQVTKTTVEDSSSEVEEKTQAEMQETDVEKPDCDGRLIPMYNFRNEITGYRCDTNAANYECPGHRAGETWTEDGAECTCKSNGEIECVQ